MQLISCLILPTEITSRVKIMIFIRKQNRLCRWSGVDDRIQHTKHSDCISCNSMNSQIKRHSAYETVQ